MRRVLGRSGLCLVPSSEILGLEGVWGDSQTVAWPTLLSPLHTYHRLPRGTPRHLSVLRPASQPSAPDCGRRPPPPCDCLPGSRDFAAVGGQILLGSCTKCFPACVSDF